MHVCSHVFTKWFNIGENGYFRAQFIEIIDMQFDIRFHLIAILFLVFDVELLFLYPWAVLAYADGLTASEREELERLEAAGGDQARLDELTARRQEVVVAIVLIPREPLSLDS